MLLAAAFFLASAHSEALAEHPYDPSAMDTPYIDDRRATEPPQLNRTVYGYLPYWVDLTKTTLHWELLSHLAWFSAGVITTTTDGVTTVAIDSEGRARLNGARYRSIRDAAKSHGVKFVITLTNFNDTTIATLVGAQRQQTLDLVVKTVKDYGAEGVNIDFEFVPKASKANFVTFMKDLTTRLHAEIPGSHVTSATPMIDHSGAYDFDQLLIHSDGMMIMGYGCHWTGSTVAGPNAPLTSGSTWYNCSVTRAIDDNIRFGGFENRKGIIMGLPFYGFEWSTETLAVKSPVTSSGQSRTYAAYKDTLVQHYAWDAASQTPFASRMVGGTPKQLWMDDAESLDLKLQLINERDIGGLGIWALGYEGQTEEFWDKIRARFTSVPTPVNAPPVADAGHFQTFAAPASWPLPVRLDGGASADPEGASLTYEWKQVAGPAVELDGTNVVRPMFLAREAGEYRFWLTVNDGTQNSSAAETQVTVGNPEPQEPVPSGPTSEPTPSSPSAPAVQPTGQRFDGTAVRGAGNGCATVAGGEAAWGLALALMMFRRGSRTKA